MEGSSCAPLRAVKFDPLSDEMKSPVLVPRIRGRTTEPVGSGPAARRVTMVPLTVGARRPHVAPPSEGWDSGIAPEGLSPPATPGHGSLTARTAMAAVLALDRAGNVQPDPSLLTCAHRASA